MAVFVRRCLDREINNKHNKYWILMNEDWSPAWKYSKKTCPKSASKWRHSKSKILLSVQIDYFNRSIGGSEMKIINFQTTKKKTKVHIYEPFMRNTANIDQKSSLMPLQLATSTQSKLTISLRHFQQFNWWNKKMRPIRSEITYISLNINENIIHRSSSQQFLYPRK